MKKIYYMCILFSLCVQNNFLVEAVEHVSELSEKQNLVQLRLSEEIREAHATQEGLYAKHALKISIDTKGVDHPLFLAVSAGLEKGNQLKIIEQSYKEVENRKKVFSLLADDHIQFYLVFSIVDQQFIWKLYNVFTKMFMLGKAYNIKNNEENDLTRTILIDIWEAIFGEGKTPFHCFLTFLETKRVDGNQLSQIFFTHPLLPGFSKKILTTKHGIIDLGKLPREQDGESLLFSLCINGAVDIVSLDPAGGLKTLIKSNVMTMSPSVNNEGLFYIAGGGLYRFYFNKISKKFVSDLLDSARNYVSICAHPTEKKLLIAKNKKVYEIIYFFNELTGEISIETAYQISSSGSIMANAVYDLESIIASERINGFYQLVLFEDKMKTVLTESSYHKQDPTVSPCGTYIAYIAQAKDGDRYVEVMNRFTGVVFRVTQTSGEYRFPVWVVR